MSISLSKLSLIPKDVLVNHIIPLISEMETFEQAMNRWALQASEWMIQYWYTKVNNLPNYAADIQAYKGCETREFIEIYFIFGATEIVPYNIYTKLTKGKGREYASMIRERQFLENARKKLVQDEEKE